MNITTSNYEGHVTIALSGRFDSAAAQGAQKEISDALKEFDEIESVTVNMTDMEYISSSGLRVIMQLKKKYPQMNITEANAEVYNVLKLTGLTRMMPVVKKLTEIDVDGLEVVEDTDKWRGYRLDEDTMVRVFPEGTPREDVERELQFIRTSFILGMPTVMPFNMVKVGNQYGLVCELLPPTDESEGAEETSTRGADDYIQSRMDFQNGMKRLENEKFFLDCDANIDYVASKLGTNRHYVSDYFNKVLKVTFTQYINTLRLNYAESLIRERRIKMSQVGYSSGFNSDHTFRRLFKEKYGCTPTEYLRK